MPIDPACAPASVQTDITAYQKSVVDYDAAYEAYDTKRRSLMPAGTIAPPVAIIDPELDKLGDVEIKARVKMLDLYREIPQACKVGLPSPYR